MGVLTQAHRGGMCHGCFSFSKWCGSGTEIPCGCQYYDRDSILSQTTTELFPTSGVSHLLWEEHTKNHCGVPLAMMGWTACRHSMSKTRTAFARRRRHSRAREWPIPAFPPKSNFNALVLATKVIGDPLSSMVEHPLFLFVCFIVFLSERICLMNKPFSPASNRYMFCWASTRSDLFWFVTLWNLVPKVAYQFLVFGPDQQNEDRSKTWWY